jgi:hypothetical protein
MNLNLPDAPIAHEGFFVTHFFTVRDQEKSKDLYVRILGGKPTPGSFSIPVAAPHPTSPQSSLKLRPIQSG